MSLFAKKFPNLISNLNQVVQKHYPVPDGAPKTLKEVAETPIAKTAIDAVKTASSLMNDPFEKKVETVEYMAKQYGGQALDYMNKHKGEIANKALEYGKEKLGEMAKNKLSAIMA